MNAEEKRRPEAGDATVFPTSQLVWLDEVTGEVLEIELIGAEPWATHLAEQGFTPRPEEPGADASTPVTQPPGRYRCRIEITSGRG